MPIPRAEHYLIQDAYGRELSLDVPGAMLVQISGLGIPPNRHQSSRSPYQHGASYLGTLYDPRIIQIAIVQNGCSREELWSFRQYIVERLNALVSPLRFRVVFDGSGDVRELRGIVYATGYGLEVADQRGPTQQTAAFRLIAYDPMWWAYPEQSVSPALTVVSGLIFPIEFPIIFGATWISETQVVTIGGTWNVYPTIVITGPMRNPLIENITNGLKLELTYKIANGEVVTISTEFGNKVITNADGDNLIGYLTTDSDLATFRLDPPPVATDGENVLGFFGNECTAASAITVSWYNRYLGL